MTERVPSRRGTLIVGAIVLACFGPYVAAGLRTEQVVLYVVAAVVFTLTAMLLRPTGPMFALLAAWVLYVAVAAIGAIDPPNAPIHWGSGSALAGLDNVLMPVAVMLVVLGLLAWGADPYRQVRVICSLVVLLMLGNVVASYLQSQGADWSAWWGTAPGETTVALYAAGNGRFGGLINQPAEAGLLYGIALLAAVYLLHGRPLVLLPVVTALTYGGALTVSKVFLLVALPLALVQMARLRRGRGFRLALLALAGAGLWFAVRAEWVPQWLGADQLRAILPGVDQSYLSAATASRLGAGSTLAPVISEVWEKSPFFGLGSGGLAVPYDNGWVEAFVMAGLVGAVVYTLVLVVWARVWRGAAPSSERSLFGSLLLLVAAASMGLPALTANRAGTVVWLLAMFLMAAMAGSGQRPDSDTVDADEQTRRGRPHVAVDR